jgi:hypothetical protein
MASWVQHVAALAIAAFAAVWLVRRAIAAAGRPGCAPHASSGPEGFVPLDALVKAPGKPARRG